MKSRTSLLAILVLFAVAISCCDEDEAPLVCGVEDPVTELQWLKDKVAEQEPYKESYLVQAQLHGNTIFFFGNCCATCLWAIIPYNCDGLQLEVANLRFEDFETTKVIWKPDGSVCNL